MPTTVTSRPTTKCSSSWVWPSPPPTELGPRWRNPVVSTHLDSQPSQKDGPGKPRACIARFLKVPYGSSCTYHFVPKVGEARKACTIYSPTIIDSGYLLKLGSGHHPPENCDQTVSSLETRDKSPTPSLSECWLCTQNGIDDHIQRKQNGNHIK